MTDAGIAPVADGLGMSRIGRNLTAADGVLAGKRHLIQDRDPLFTTEFLRTLWVAGLKSVRSPPRSPGECAQAERFVRSELRHGEGTPGWRLDPGAHSVFEPCARLAWRRTG